VRGKVIFLNHAIHHRTGCQLECHCVIVIPLAEVLVPLAERNMEASPPAYYVCCRHLVCQQADPVAISPPFEMLKLYKKNVNEKSKFT
jgi:hypothetical protein